MKQTIIDLCDFVEKRITEVSSERDFKLVKLVPKKNIFAALNVALELRYHLIMDDVDVTDKAVEDCIEVLNKLFFKVFTKTGNIKASHYDKPKEY